MYLIFSLYFSPKMMIEKEVALLGAKVSAITHGHPLSHISSYTMTSIINKIVYGNYSSLEEIVNSAIESVKRDFGKYKEDLTYFENLMNKAIQLSKQNINDISSIEQLGEGWVAEETLAIAVYSCLKYSNSFEKAIVCSVNHSGDSDSTGAVAGNIIGAYLGYEAIPNYYLDNLELKDIILEIANDLFIRCPVSEYSDNNDEYWLNKYTCAKYEKNLEKKKEENLSDEKL